MQVCHRYETAFGHISLFIHFIYFAKSNWILFVRCIHVLPRNAIIMTDLFFNRTFNSYCANVHLATLFLTLDAFLNTKITNCLQVFTGVTIAQFPLSFHKPIQILLKVDVYFYNLKWAHYHLSTTGCTNLNLEVGIS